MGKVQLPSIPNPTEDPGDSLPPKGRPFLFQVVDQNGQSIWPVLLALHVNPRSLEERMTKSKTVVMTYGGFVEWLWPDELDAISGGSSTGAFLNPESGLAAGSDSKGALSGGGTTRLGAVGRHGTMAWERQEDFLELFRSNGMVFNGAGQPAIRGRVQCIYDRGIFTGFFTTFEVKEDDSHAFSFELSWEFKVEHTVYKFPQQIDVSGGRGRRPAQTPDTQGPPVNPSDSVDVTPVEGPVPDSVTEASGPLPEQLR